MKPVILICTLVFSLSLFGQEKLNNLQAPTSPASSILDLQPKVVLSPKTYQTLETALFSSFIQDFRPVIPNDFSLEFTPYWAKNHSLSLEDYLYPKSMTDQFVRNLSVSLASTQNFKLGDSAQSNSLAYGLRTTFYFGNKNDREILNDFEKKSDDIRKVYNRISIQAEKTGDAIQEGRSATDKKASFLINMKPVIYNTLYRVYNDLEMAEAMTEKILLDCDTLPEIENEDPFTFIDLFNTIVDRNLRGEVVFNEYKSYIKERQGLSVDLAYAGFLNFPSNKFEYAFMPRQSLWITPSYRFRGDYDFIIISGVLRYDWYHEDYYRKYFPGNIVFKNNLDYGLEIAARFRKISLEFEMAGRTSNSYVLAGVDLQGNDLYRKEHNSDFQYIGSVHYNLTDQIILSYNLGNRFELIQNQNNTLVSLLSLNFGFGAPDKNILDLQYK